MNEKTRKTLAIWLIGMCFGVMVCTCIAQVFYWGILYEKGYSVNDLNLLFGIAPLFLMIGLLVGSVLILGKLLNKVTRSFYYRFVVAFAISEMMITMVVSFSEIIWGLCSLLCLILVMSGAGMLSQNYTMSAYINSKLRLFQTGVIFVYGRGLVFGILSWLRDPFFYSALDIINVIILLVGIICIIWGVIGIIRSDLVGENRKKDVLGKVGGGWLTRPVVGAACFVGLLLCILFFIPDFITSLNI